MADIVLTQPQGDTDIVLIPAEDGPVIILENNQSEVELVLDGGLRGETGPAGPQGETGVGVPTGGTTGQVLAKNSNTAYDTDWVDASSEIDETNLVHKTLDETITGYKLFQNGFLMQDSSSVVWKVIIDTDGALHTDPYSSDSLSDSFISEDGLYYFITEDSASYFAQE